MIFREALHKVWEKLFRPFWGFYYEYFNSPPISHYIRELKGKNRKGVIYDLEHFYDGDFYDPVCFPLPLKINCVACTGCASNKNPFLTSLKDRGPYLISLSDTFISQYKEMCGEQALIELLYKLEIQNEEIRKGRSGNKGISRAKSG